MILTDMNIVEAMRDDLIEIKPYNPKQLGSNSYDLTLSKHLAIYQTPNSGVLGLLGAPGHELDCKKDNPITRMEIPEEGYVMRPGTLYLGSTQEWTRTRHHVPFIEGKSSVGRLGITAHITAGMGDIGFAGHWTLEITVVHPVKVYAGMPIAQILFMHFLGKCNRPYSLKDSAKYHNQGALPAPSMMWKNFPLKEIV